MTELVVLTVAEVVALSYYGGLAADAPDPVVRAVAARIVAGEHPHVRFQKDRLRAGFVASGIPLRVLAFAFRWLTAIGYRRLRFVRDVLGDFSRVAAEVLRRRNTLL